MAFFDNIGRKNDSSITGGRTMSLQSGRIMPSGTSASQGVLFSKGQVFKGEVIDLRGENIKLLLPDSRILSAKLNNALLLSIGQKASFQVSEADNSTITLKLLAQNTGSATEMVINKALTEAGLPKSERNSEAVSALLEQQMSINKDSLHKLLQTASTYKNASMSTLAIMHKYNIPMNEVNTSQFEAYRNYEHRIVSQTDSIISSLSEFMNTSDAIFSDLNNTIIDMLANSDKSAQMVPSTNSAVTDNAMPNGMVADNASLPENITTPTTATVNTSETTAPTTSGNAVATTKQPTTEPSPTASTVEVQHMTEAPLDAQSIEKQIQNFNAKELVYSDTPSSENTQSLSALFKNIAKALESGTLSHKELSKNEDYKELVKTALSNNFTLSPEELNAEDGIRKYYSRLTEDLEKLNKTLERLPEEHELSSQLKSNISGLKDNVQFMNTLNNIFAYVQLPLKLSNQNTHGELYVYTKKEKLRQNPDNVSVLLHLDMEHLGPCDIYLNMVHTNISSKFYLEDTSSIDLIEQNISELSDALTKKGYSLSHEILERKERAPQIEDFIAPEVQTSAGTKRFTFDVRA